MCTENCHGGFAAGSPASIEHNRWLKGDMNLWQSQLNFACYIATSACGISSKEHLNHPNALVRSIYRFHAYYQMRRVLRLLNVKTPLNEGFDKLDNPYDKNEFFKLCREFDTPTDPTAYKNKYYLASHQDGYYVEYTDTSFTRYIIEHSVGLTSQALVSLSESVRCYVYLILSSQEGARKTILDSPTSRQIYLDSFEELLHRSVDLSEDVSRYQKVLKYARSKVDFAIAEGVYMLPSNMQLHVGRINNYNNSLLIANSNIKIGEINHGVNAEILAREKLPMVYPTVGE